MYSSTAEGARSTLEKLKVASRASVKSLLMLKAKLVLFMSRS